MLLARMAAKKPTPPKSPSGSPPFATLGVKVVPGSRREEIVGWLGERLKVKVSAPPEDGRANEAVCRLIAATLGIGVRAVSVVSGHSRPEKTLRIEGVVPETLASRLGVADAGGSSR